MGRSENKILSAKSKRRDTLSIMAQILEITKEGILKTQIMYKANLSFTQLNDYLQFMVKNNLITHKTHEGREVYIITLKGSNFLQMHTELLQLLRTEISSPVKISPKTRSKPKTYSRNVQAPSAVH
jgi:predicted transcriptional regulator